VRLKLTLSYAGFLMVAGAALLAVVWVFLLRYVPSQAAWTQGGFMPGRDDLVRAFLPRAGLALAFLLVVGLVGGWVLAGRMLAPLDRVTAATRLAQAGSLSHRVALEGRRDEFRELADSFDAMLARLEAHVAEQQRFAANASHELRTPLAVTQTLLDVARRDPDHDHSELLDRLYAVNARAISLTEALLLLSRAEGRAFEWAPVDLSLVAEEAAETLLPLAEARAVRVEASGDAAWALGSAALLNQLAANLVHNGIVHNLPEGGFVRVNAIASPGAAALTVENTGPELDPALVATLAEPFQRGAERVGAGHAGTGYAGTGLGLAIVESVARAHGGTLVLEPRAGGGLRATVWLPPAPQQT
jgi:two-component system sensor histidine kinase VanS